MVLFAKDIVEKDFLSLQRGVTAAEAAKMMKSSRHGFVVVVDSVGKPEGIVTEWDYLSKLVAEDKDPSKAKLEDIMSTNLVTVNADDEIDTVSQIMSQRGIRRVLVIQKGKVIGVITARTVLSRLKEYIDRVSTQIARLQAPRL
jgi:IMP dehydrogenase